VMQVLVQHDVGVGVERKVVTQCDVGVQRRAR
jgi:hypothetical protein